MDTMHSPQHTKLVTQYIELHDAWVMESDVYVIAELDARMHAMALQFTAAQWKELFTRRD